MATLGARIKELREEKGVTQRELTEYLNYKTTRSVQRIESDEQTIDHLQVIQLANYFKVTSDYLLGLTDVRPVKSLITASLDDLF
ncbi:helix-turn-helix domain-containing protein [Cohnella silvisoli]|uniref:Helix-turn-helix transcriptional regulator n=1 Tax=Cohnella silvisoli TaxID=2873699 RepID=A0ABV1KYS0_9BACL|nr:helix-turn-helix transcriptional regulator [Cohnella silvisoli]MCD9024376.1 helix-turn-helix domain-containing protein [Cohnella silvisoli]